MPVANCLKPWKFQWFQPLCKAIKRTIMVRNFKKRTIMVRLRKIDLDTLDKRVTGECCLHLLAQAAGLVGR